MDTVLSPELPQVLRLIIALGIVFALMGGLVFVLKKLGLSEVMPAKRSGDKRRLEVLESLPLDARRRLAVIRCDSREHLVILGANKETVIDTDIPPASVDETAKTGDSS